MFGELKVNKILSLTTMETPDQAAAKLLEFAEYPQDPSLVPVSNGPGGFSRPR